MHTIKATALDLDVKASRVRVCPFFVVIGIRVEIGVIYLQTLRPSPNPHHHVPTILNIIWDVQRHVIAFLVHMAVRDLSNGVCREVGLRPREPVGLSKIVLVCELNLFLASPVHTDETGVTVVWGAYVPASVAIAPEAHAKRVSRLSSGHRDIGGIDGGGLQRTACKIIGVRSTIQVPHVPRRLVDPVTVVDFVARMTNAGLVAGTNNVSVRHIPHHNIQN